MPKLFANSGGSVEMPHSASDLCQHCLPVTPVGVSRLKWAKYWDKYLLAFFPAGGNFYRLLITFANSLDPDQARQNIGSDLDINCLTLWWYSWKISFENVNLKKKKKTTRKMFNGIMDRFSQKCNQKVNLGQPRTTPNAWCQSGHPYFKGRIFVNPSKKINCGCTSFWLQGR